MSSAASPSPAHSRGVRLAAAVIVLAIGLAYANTLSAPFVFDDIPAIRDNPTIRHLGMSWFPPSASGLPVDGRPVANFSFALSYALSGTDVGVYRAMNVLIHALSALTLFGLVRQTLLRSRAAETATQIAACAALLWAVHPLQTESVTYVVQRVEALMALFFLFTLYAFARAIKPDSSRAWSLVAIMACALGMGTKEVMVVAPLVVLLYDRTFVSGTLREAWRRHRTIHLSLMATWLIVLVLAWQTGGRGGTAGFATSISPLAYLATQMVALVRYLWLTLYPTGLVLDYGTRTITDPLLVAPCAILIGALVVGALLALRRAPAIGFLGAAWFLILAPTSSVVPIATQTIAEHRMYLPLAALIVGGVVGAQRWLGTRAWIPAGGIAIALIALTHARNADYHSSVTIWSNVVARQPDNPRAHSNLADALALAGKKSAALAEYDAALHWDPEHVEANYNLGNLLLAAGDAAGALRHYETVLRRAPHHLRARRNFGNALAALGRYDEALATLADVARETPGSPETECDWGNALAAAGRKDEAAVHLETALRLKPDFAAAHDGLGNLAAESGKLDDAAAHYLAALRIAPDRAETHDHLGLARAQQERFTEAIAEFESALQLRPDFAEAHDHLGMALAAAGQFEQARAQFETALQLNPNLASARQNLERLRAMGR